MAYRFVVFVCIQAVCLQNVYTACIPNAPSCTSQVVTETCVQNPLYLNQPANIIAQPLFSNIGLTSLSPCDINYALPTLSGTTTVVQDGSVANNLANALQLLIVSNLLGNTLPCNDVVNVGVAPSLPLLKPGLPLVQSGLPLVQSGLPLVQSGLPLVQSGLPLVQSGLPLVQPGLLGLGYGLGCGCGCNGVNLVL